ncbi:DUF480 domain-containing protein [Alienimonas californiensis]|uniref:Uncharacterized protein n=1 Tax=Alienimonas californiensis TaxID=2527989 RepID=A0A517PDM3_9PLAN|nr:DUF480 domain-containing protein [Alienimonas californiensis]QDT17464.1 hypothetical protein CA12_35890 [Alienimonas californiensis]
MDAEDQFPPFKTLTRPQRRVIGTLIEKGLTTPGSYPLTLKAVVTGCNQTSNREPITNYSEGAALETLDDLAALGLAAEVHTAGGRAAKYRHLVRKRLTITEPQIAVLAELMLRGRQSLGELRARASRMVPIASLEDLREALDGLMEMGFVSADGPLERRGATVDHALYPPNEAPPAAPAASPAAAASPGSARPASAGPAVDPEELAALKEANEELRTELAELTDRVGQLADALDDLRRDLGVT